MTHITRSFASDGNRYEIDRGPCSYANGFCQIDTDQDAGWYGTWTSPERRIIATYAEGDIIVEKAEDDYEYRKALVNHLTSHSHVNPNRPHAMIDIGLTRSAEFREMFVSLGLASYIY